MSPPAPCLVDVVSGRQDLRQHSASLKRPYSSGIDTATVRWQQGDMIPICNGQKLEILQSPLTPNAVILASVSSSPESPYSPLSTDNEAGRIIPRPRRTPSEPSFWTQFHRVQNLRICAYCQRRPNRVTALVMSHTRPCAHALQPNPVNPPNLLITRQLAQTTARSRSTAS